MGEVANDAQVVTVPVQQERGAKPPGIPACGAGCRPFGAGQHLVIVEFLVCQRAERRGPDASDLGHLLTLGKCQQEDRPGHRPRAGCVGRQEGLVEQPARASASSVSLARENVSKNSLSSVSSRAVWASARAWALAC